MPQQHCPATPTMCRQLAQLTLAAARAEADSPALAAACRLALHAFGVGLAGAALPAARIARQAVAGASGASGPCLVFGTAGSQAAQDAAFANAVAGHAGLLEDSGPGGLRNGSHPGTYVFAAALAAAQERGATGLALLRALTAAYEAVDALGRVVPAAAARRGFRPLALLGPFGAVAAAGVLGGLDEPALAQAYAIAANLAAGTNQGFVDGTMEPYLHPAFAARNGLLAVRLVAAGCTASPQGLEGSRGLFALLDDAGPEAGAAGPELAALPEPAVCRVGAKRFASCLYNQGTLTLLREALPQGLACDAVEHVVLARPATGLNGLSAPGVAALPEPATPLQLQMSARFTCAAALLGRPVEDAGWYTVAPKDTAVLALARRIELKSEPSSGVRIELSLHGAPARTLQRDDTSPLMFGSAEVEAEFRSRVRPWLGERADEACARLAALHRLDSLAPLAELARAAASPPGPTATHRGR